MFSRCIARRSRATPEAITNYWNHLFPTAGVDVPALASVLPSATDGTQDAYRFQRLVVDKLNHTGSDVVGWKLVLPTDATLRNLKQADALCSPLFSTWRHDTGAHFNIQQRRLQNIDMMLVVELSHVPDVPVGTAVKEGFPEGIAAVYPALEICGSRYPFYAPHAAGFLADLTSHAGIIIGTRVPSENLSTVDLAALGGVLLRNDEPVGVGHGRDCLGHPAIAASVTAHLARQHVDADIKPGSLIACGNVARAPAQPGTFEANFGPIGSVSLTLE
jgi:2-keto-4-pentenoate hydratase